MVALTCTQQGWARAFAAWVVIVGPAGCGDGSGGLTPTPQTQHVLRVQASGAGSGTVTALDALPPLSCTILAGALSGVCVSAYPSNATVRLVATPNGASTFVEWSGACTGTGECVVDMSQERTATASFAPPTTTTSLADSASAAGYLVHHVDRRPPAPTVGTRRYQRFAHDAYHRDGVAGQLTRALIDGSCATDAKAERVRRELADCPAAALGGARVPTRERLSRRTREVVVRRGQDLDGGGIDAATLVDDELQPDVAFDSGFREQRRVAEWVVDGRLRGAIDLAAEVCRAVVTGPRCDGVRAARRRGPAEHCDGEVGGARAGDCHNDECHAPRAHDRMTRDVGERNRRRVQNAQVTGV
jgi:hypothetical protein